MRDLYEQGLRGLRARLPPAALDEFNTYEARLLENLRREQLFGGTDGTRAERAVVIDGLNQLARRYLDVSFNELCRNPTEVAALPTPINPSPRRGQAERRSSSEPPIPVTMEFRADGDDVAIAWRAPIVGEVVTPFAPPYDDATLPLVFRALDAGQYLLGASDGSTFSAEEQNTLATLGLWRGDWVAPNIHNTVGLALHSGLGPAGISTLSAVRNYGINQGQTTSYMLRFPQNALRLAALPWELIADEDGAVLLGRGTDIDWCERYITLERASPPPLGGARKPHLLALLPTYGIAEAERREEHESRLMGWERLRAGGQITFDEISPLTRSALIDYLRSAERKPDIVHYFGRGAYQDGHGYLLFDSNSGGASPVSAAQLAAVLGDIRLVVLQASHSATVGTAGGLLASIAPAISLVTGAVVAMQLTLPVASGARFAEVFYDELLRRRRSLQAAVAMARQTLFFEEEASISWFAPTLYIRAREQGPVFVVEP